MGVRLNSWNYSNEKNELSREQQLSTIMLLEKKGKSMEHLNNLKTITLTNCDVKTITKREKKELGVNGIFEFTQLCNVVIEIRLDLGIIDLVIALKVNLESGPQFAQV